MFAARCLGDWIIPGDKQGSRLRKRITPNNNTCSLDVHHSKCTNLSPADPGGLCGPGPPCSQEFSKIMQFSGNFKGKNPILRKFWAQGPPWGQNSTGPPDQGEKFWFPLAFSEQFTQAVFAHKCKEWWATLEPATRRCQGVVRGKRSFTGIQKWKLSFLVDFASCVQNLVKRDGPYRQLNFAKISYTAHLFTKETHGLFFENP